MIRLGTVADDLTGATTAAALFARSGISAIAYWDLDAAENAKNSDADAVLLSTGSRAMKPEEAYETVSRATRILRDIGAPQYQKRIDTTLRGGIGAEIDAMLDVLGDDYLAVVVPSMPQNHRIVIGGYSLIDGDLLSRTEVRNDARTPVHESFIPRLLSAQTRRPVKQLTAESLALGKEAIAMRLKTLYNQGVRVIVADAVSMDDIRLIADACQESGLKVLSVDPGPFTACLAGEAKPDHAVETVRKEEACGTVLVAVGSTTEHSRRQIDILCADPQTERVVLHPECFLTNGPDCAAEIDRAVNEVRPLLLRKNAPQAVVLDASSEAALFGQREERLRDKAHDKNGKDPVGDCLGQILHRLLSENEVLQRVCGLYLTGGDTMAAILARLEVDCVRVHDYIVPQVDLCHLVGGQLDGMIVVSKGGLTGDDQIGIRIVQKILQEAAREGLSFR